MRFLKIADARNAGLQDKTCPGRWIGKLARRAGAEHVRLNQDYSRIANFGFGNFNVGFGNLRAHRFGNSPPPGFGNFSGRFDNLQELSFGNSQALGLRNFATTRIWKLLRALIWKLSGPRIWKLHILIDARIRKLG